MSQHVAGTLIPPKYGPSPTPPPAALITHYLTFIFLLLTLILPWLYRRLAPSYKTFRSNINQLITETYNYGLTPADLYNLSHPPLIRHLPPLRIRKPATYKSAAIRLPLNRENRIDDSVPQSWVYLDITADGHARLICAGENPAPIQPHL